MVPLGGSVERIEGQGKVRIAARAIDPTSVKRTEIKNGPGDCHKLFPPETGVGFLLFLPYNKNEAICWYVTHPVIHPSICPPSSSIGPRMALGRSVGRQEQCTRCRTQQQATAAVGCLQAFLIPYLHHGSLE